MWVKQVNETWANRKTSFEKSIDEMSLVELEKRYGQVIQSEQNLRRTGSNWSLPSDMSYEEYRYIIKRYDQLVAAGDLSLAGMKTLDKMFSNLRVGDKVEIDALSRQELMEKYSYVWHGKPSIDYEYLFLSDAEKAKKDYIYYRFEALMAEKPIDFRDPAFTEKYIAHINATGKNPFTGEPVSSDVKFMAKHYNTVQAWSTLGASLAGGYMDYSDLTSSSGLGSLSDDMDEISKSTKVSIQTTTSDTKGTRIKVISQKTGSVKIGGDGFSPEWEKLRQSFPNPNLEQSIIDDIVTIKVDSENGEFRPNPENYLGSEYIESHNARFENGVAAFARDTSNLERFGQFGRDDGAFVFPKDVAEAMVREADGNPRVLEKLLGLDEGSLGEHPIMIEPREVSNLRIPSGNEGGSKDNIQWRPGGLTYPGGVPEAVIDPVLTDTLNITKLW